MIEMATGQLQAATPFGTNGRNETASGMSMMLGASIRRTRRTMANIERSFMNPLLRKAIDRFTQFDPRYIEGAFGFRLKGTLGMMAREFESMQLGPVAQRHPAWPESVRIAAGCRGQHGADRQAGNPSAPGLAHCPGSRTTPRCSRPWRRGPNALRPGENAGSSAPVPDGPGPLAA